MCFACGPNVSDLLNLPLAATTSSSLGNDRLTHKRNLWDLRRLCMQFLDTDPDVAAWGGVPEGFADAPDCDVMAYRFAHFAKDRGHQPVVVEALLEAAQDGLGSGAHWFTVIRGVGVDWTARQFHNIRGVVLDPSEIPCPMLFLWPGPFPIPTIRVVHHVCHTDLATGSL